MAGANKIRALLAARQDKDRGDDVKAFRSRPSLLRGSKPDHGGGRRGRTTRARGSQRGLRLSRMEALDPQKKKNVLPNGSRDPKATLLEFSSGRLQEC